MTIAAPRASRWSRRPRAFSLAVAIGVAVPIVAAVVLAVLAERASTPTASAPSVGGGVAEERDAFLAYQRAVETTIEDGGFVVVNGMRPGVSDIADGKFPDDTLVTMAGGWVSRMEEVRAQLGGVEPPPFLADAADLYDEALAAYVEVAEALLGAAQATGVERASLIEAVPPLGQRADELWDAAKAELDRHRSRLGVAATLDVPAITGTPDGEE